MSDFNKPVGELADNYINWFHGHINKIGMHTLFLGSLIFVIWPYFRVGLSVLAFIIGTISLPLIGAIIAAFIRDVRAEPQLQEKIREAREEHAKGFFKEMLAGIIFLIMLSVAGSIIIVVLEVYFSVEFTEERISAFYFMLIFGIFEVSFLWKLIFKKKVTAREG
jgi:hypothetical protein